MKLEFEEKENLGNRGFYRKNDIKADDINQIKQSVNTLYDEKQDNIIVLTQGEYNLLNPVDETKIYFIVG
jgi:hypothetical protein